jgi:putative ABC transport system substrate-binding protein
LNNRRKLLAVFGAGALVAPLASFAQQQPAKVPRIGFLGAESASGYTSRVDALRAGLRELGYVEGKNIAIEFRWADGNNDRLPELAAELVRLKVDVIVTHAFPGTRAARQATTTIPIVTAAVADPVALGLVASLARPGGNVTGSTFFYPEVIAKRLELLKVLLNPDGPAIGTFFSAMQLSARSLKVALHRFEARGLNEFEGAFSAMAKKRIEAVAVIEDPIFFANAKGLADLAAKQRFSSIGFNEYAEAGGLIGYGANYLELWRRAAYFVERILKGTKPADLPIEQPTKFELVINMKTAKALGIKIPSSILLRADKVL